MGRYMFCPFQARQRAPETFAAFMALTAVARKPSLTDPCDVLFRTECMPLYHDIRYIRKYYNSFYLSIIYGNTLYELCQDILSVQSPEGALMDSRGTSLALLPSRRRIVAATVQDSKQCCRECGFVVSCEEETEPPITLTSGRMWKVRSPASLYNLHQFTMFWATLNPIP